MINITTIGEIRTAKNGNKYIITGKDYEKSNNKHTYYNIRFIESGYEDSVRGDSISNGYIKDNLAKNSYGGCVGYANSREHPIEFKIWTNMMHRCNDPNDKSYKYYGGNGVTICERWYRFDNFLEDVKNIPGYDQQLFEERKLKLDKDILSINQKQYSPETTMWVTEEQNQKQRTIEYNTNHKKYAIFPDGHKELITNVTDFCKEHGLHRQNVNLCLKGKQKSSKGFKFYREQS